MARKASTACDGPTPGEVEHLEFTIYHHPARLVPEDEEAVTPITIPMTLTRSANSRTGKWYLDYVGLEPIRELYPGIGQRGRHSGDVTWEPVLRGAVRAVEDAGIEPGEVKNWKIWFPDYFIQRVLYGGGGL